MGRGISLHIGVNYVDTQHYQISMRLPHCVNDARAMQYIADQNNFESCLLVNEQATSYNLFFVINKAIAELVSGDILFISFSGHGTNFIDLNGDEDDGYDEGLVFYDRVVIDDELHCMWTNFRFGVRILFISDSCHSGTVTKDINSIIKRFLGLKDNTYQLPFIYEKNKSFYDSKFKNLQTKIKTPILCSVLLLSACQDDQLAGAGLYSEVGLSTFTEALMHCWANGNFEGNYRELLNQIKIELKKRKKGSRPNYYFIGDPNPLFQGQIPFTI